MAFISTKNYSQKFCVTLVSMFTKHYIHCNTYQLCMTGSERDTNLMKPESFTNSLQKIRSDEQHYETFRPVHKFKILMPEECWGHGTVKYKCVLVQQGKYYTSKFSFSHPPSTSRFQYTSDHLTTQYNGTTTGNS